MQLLPCVYLAVLCDIMLHALLSSIVNRLPFRGYPTPCFLKNNRSAFKHPEFVVKAIEELLCHNCIVEHEFPTYCVNPLTVAEGKKLRLVIDLRHVNAFVSKVKFKYEDLRSLSQVLEENHWFFIWDLKSGNIIMSTSLQITKSI